MLLWNTVVGKILDRVFIPCKKRELRRNKMYKVARTLLKLICGKLPDGLPDGNTSRLFGKLKHKGQTSWDCWMCIVGIKGIIILGIWLISLDWSYQIPQGCKYHLWIQRSGSRVIEKQRDLLQLGTRRCVAVIIHCAFILDFWQVQCNVHLCLCVGTEWTLMFEKPMLINKHKSAPIRTSIISPCSSKMGLICLISYGWFFQCLGNSG